MSLAMIGAVQQGETRLTLDELLRQELRMGRLVPWLRRAAQEAYLRDQARALGLAVDEAELQAASDRFRRRNQLLAKEQMQAWLAQRRLSVDEFEAALETEILHEKLKRLIAAPERVAARFKELEDAFDELRLRLILTPREDLAREILLQIVEEGADFAEMAREHSLRPSRATGGDFAACWRRQLAPALRDAMHRAEPGSLLGHIPAAEGFLIVRVDGVTRGALDARVEAILAHEIFDDWLRDRLASAPFAVPLLDLLQ